MKLLKKLTTPPWLALGLGVPALILMALRMATGLDDRDLFIPGHFAGILLWILVAAMALLAFLTVRLYGGKAKYSRLFQASVPAAIGILGAAVAVLWCSFCIWFDGADLLETTVALLGLAAGGSLAYLAWCRSRGLRSSFLLWSLVTIFLMLRLMLSYRVWSAQPELLRYCFPLFASICITLAFYYRTAFCVGLGNRQRYLFFTQMSAFFCLITLGAGFDLFYLGMLLWCVLDLPSLRLLKAAPRDEVPEEQP